MKVKKNSRKSEVFINPLCLPILSTSDLEAAIPDFNWRSGHSGEVLSQVQARKLKHLWNGFLVSNAEALAGNAYNRNAGEWNSFGITDMACRREGH